MRRIIKFRGKRVDNGEWRICTSIEVSISGITLIGYEEVNPETVGQFTGLLDKNGKEIYEGDILQHGYVAYQYVIEYNGSGFKCCKRPGEVCFSLFEANLHEVIGNIHDNPELLKTE